MVIRDGVGVQERELNRLSIGTSSAVTKYKGCNVEQNKYSYNCSTLHMKDVKRVNPKHSHHQEKHLFLFLLFYIYMR